MLQKIHFFMIFTLFTIVVSLDPNEFLASKTYHLKLYNDTNDPSLLIFEKTIIVAQLTSQGIIVDSLECFNRKFFSLLLTPDSSHDNITFICVLFST
jgi:hypothetical protein